MAGLRAGGPGGPGVRRGGPADGALGHADLAPGVPVDRRDRQVAEGVVVVGHGVQEGVGRAVVHLPEPAGDGQQGGAQDDEVQVRRDLAAGLQQRERAVHLRRQHRGGRLRVLELHQAAAGHARGVHDAVHGPEALHGPAHRGRHGGAVGDVGADDLDAGAELLQPPHPLDPPGQLGVGPGARGVPLLAWRQPVAADQHEVGADRAGQVTGQLQGHAAQTAGDQVGAAPAQPGVVLLRAVDRGGQEHPPPAAGAPQRDLGVGDRLVQLGHEGVQGPGLVTAARGGGEADVHAAAGDARRFARPDLGGAQQQGLERLRVAAVQRVQVAGDDRDGHLLAGARPAERLCQEQQAVEGAPPELGGVGTVLRVGHRPAVHDVPRPCGGSVELAQQGGVVLGAVGPYGVLPVARFPPRIAGSDRHHPVSALGQPCGDVVADRPVVEEHQPVGGLVGGAARGEQGRQRFPARYGEPLGEVLLADEGGNRRRSLLGLPTGGDAVLAQVEGGCGQGDPGRAAVDGGPLHR